MGKVVIHSRNADHYSLQCLYSSGIDQRAKGTVAGIIPHVGSFFIQTSSAYLGIIILSSTSQL